jgi:hypothetical protein
LLVLCRDVPERDRTENHRASADALIVAAIAAGKTQGQAAESAGLSISTVDRRLQDESFRGEVDAARREMMTRTVGLLADAATGAVAVLVEIANDGEQAAAARVSAARAILTAQHQQVELVELGQRVAALEAALAAQENQKGRRAA